MSNIYLIAKWFGLVFSELFTLQKKIEVLVLGLRKIFWGLKFVWFEMANSDNVAKMFLFY